MSGKLPVYRAAFSGSTNSMLLVDIDAVRTRIKALPWVADASVSRRLPDTLRVIIHERVPIAVWQYQKRLALIDASGKLLPTDHLENYAALPLIIGQGANLRVAEALALPEGHPAAFKALTGFARLNHQQGLLGKGFAKFDLRLPGRMTVKLQSDVEAAAVPAHEMTI
jgi:cell division protein FtsQ